jgi:hypothetical protein
MLASNDLTLSFATLQEAPAIRQFIDEHWQRSHVLSMSGELLRWAHLDPARGRLNFACGKLNGDLVGILGFIPISHFDSSLPYAADLWLALWKVRPDVKLPGLGIALLEYLRHELSPQNIYVIGINAQVARIYPLLGFGLVDLDHFYRANPSKNNFELLSGAVEFHNFTESPDVSVRIANDELDAFRDVIEADIFTPRKSVEYVRNRYLRHPFYHYDLLGTWRGNRPSALIVARKATVGTATAVRIVDLFANDHDLAYAGPAIQKLIINADAEYADFYCHGYNPGSLRAAGLVQKQPDVIVPNYFEPFAPSNVPIHCAVQKTSNRSLRIVRGDADQDRPNKLPYSE